MSEDTRLLYCTTGVLLEKLVQTKTLSQFTHIILDEVHERDKDMDFLFIIIRMLMSREATNVRIVLMSATIETAKVFHRFSKAQFHERIQSNSIFWRYIYSLLNISVISVLMSGFRLQLFELISVVNSRSVRFISMISMRIMYVESIFVENIIFS